MPSVTAGSAAEKNEFVMSSNPPQQPGPNLALPAPFGTLQLILLAASRCMNGFARDTMTIPERLSRIVADQKAILLASPVGVASSAVLRVGYDSATHARTSVRGVSTTYNHPLLTTAHPMHQCDLAVCLAGFAADFLPSISPFDSANDILNCTNTQCRLTIHTLCYFCMLSVKIFQERAYFNGDGQRYRMEQLGTVFNEFIMNCLMCSKPFSEMIRMRLLAAFYCYSAIFGLTFDFSSRTQVKSSRYIAGASREREPPYAIHLDRSCNIKITALTFNHINPANFRSGLLPILPVLAGTANLRLLSLRDLSILVYQTVLARCLNGIITDLTVLPTLRSLMKGEIDGRGSCTSLYEYSLERPLKITVLRQGVREDTDENTDTAS